MIDEATEKQFSKCRLFALCVTMWASRGSKEGKTMRSGAGPSMRKREGARSSVGGRFCCSSSCSARAGSS